MMTIEVAYRGRRRSSRSGRSSRRVSGFGLCIGSNGGLVLGFDDMGSSSSNSSK